MPNLSAREPVAGMQHPLWWLSIEGDPMNIIVNDQVYLSEVQSSDKTVIVEHLKERDIYERTLRIPFPYTDADADAWLARVAEMTKQQGRPVHFAIRETDGSFLGACGFVGDDIGKSHRAEIGYWLAKPYWGRGIMTAVVQRLCHHAFEEFFLTKITAQVNAINQASARVLEKCGFQQEGYLRKQYLKDGQFLDAKLFARFR